MEITLRPAASQITIRSNEQGMSIAVGLGDEVIQIPLTRNELAELNEAIFFTIRNQDNMNIEPMGHGIIGGLARQYVPPPHTGPDPSNLDF